CGLRAFLHHLAELAGQDELAAARRARRLDEQDVAADRRPGEAGGDAGHAGAHGDLVLEAPGAQDLRDVGRLDADRSGLAFGEAHGGAAEYPADVALEIAHAGLARVVANDGAQRIFRDADALLGEAVGVELAAHEIAPRDLKLVLLGVAGKL